MNTGKPMFNEPCLLKIEMSWRVKPEIVNQYMEA